VKILVPMDGSPAALRALDEAIREARRDSGGGEIHLLNVQTPLTGPHVRMLATKASIDELYRLQGEEALGEAKERLARAGVLFVPHIGVGDPGEVVRDYVVAQSCVRVVMGTRGLGNVVGAVLGSVATKVAHLCPVPVLLVK